LRWELWANTGGLGTASLNRWLSQRVWRNLSQFPFFGKAPLRGGIWVGPQMGCSNCVRSSIGVCFPQLGLFPPFGSLVPPFPLGEGPFYREFFFEKLPWGVLTAFRRNKAIWKAFGIISAKNKG